MSQKKLLCFHWRAKYKNDSYISQFEGENEVHHFGHIWGPKAKNSQNELIEFQLISSIDNTIVYSVNLKDGVFNLNGEIVRPKFDFAIPADKTLVDMGEVKIKPIYWRRVRQHLFVEIGQQIRHLFGYELSYRGNFAKKVFAINEAGEWEEVDEKELKTISSVPGDFINLVK